MLEFFVLAIDGVLRALRRGVFWFLLILLLGFVLFIEFVADVGGERPAVPKPLPTPSNTPSAATMHSGGSWEFDYSLDSSSKTRSPLS